MATKPTSVGFRTVNGLRLRVDHRTPLSPQPADLPVVVLHGWGAHLEAVAPIVNELDAAGVEVLALDLPGFGQSEPPPEAWGSEDFARLVLAVLDEAGLDRVRLIGHSRGGTISLVLATEHADRIDRLLLIDAAGLKPRRGLRYYRRVGFAKIGRLVGFVGGPPGRRLQERMRARVASTDYLEASPFVRGTFRRVIAENVEDRLPAVRSPTLIIWGADDDDTPLWMGERMRDRIPDAGLVVFENAGHFSYVDQSDRFMRVMMTFLVDQPRHPTS